MATTPGPPVRPREPVARRAYRHPGTGHEVALRVERDVADPGGEPPRWWVDLEDTPGGPSWLSEVRYLMRGTRTQARRDFAERQRALRVAGYVQVE